MAVRGVSEQQDVGEHRHRGRWRGQRRRWRRGRGRPDVDGLRERSVAPPAEPSSTSSSNAGRVLRAEQRRSPSQRWVEEVIVLSRSSNICKSSRIDQVRCIWFGDWIPSRRGDIYLEYVFSRSETRWKTDLRKPPRLVFYPQFIRGTTFDRRLSCSFFFFFSIGKRSFFFFERGNYEDDGSRASRRGFRKTRERSLCKSKRGREGRWGIKVKVSGVRFPFELRRVERE